MKKIPILIFLFTCFVSFSIDNKKIFQDFNTAKLLYTNRKYDEANRIFLIILNKGYDNFEINYNIGCSYFKLNKFGLARFYFERALFYKPFDKDLFDNLNVIYKKSLKEPLAGEQIIMNKRLIVFIPTWLIIILLIMLTVFGTFFFILIYKANKYKKSFFIMFCSTLIFIFTFFIFLYFQYTDFNQKIFIVKTKEANVYLAPNDQESILTNINEGIRGKILEESSEYIRFALNNDINGWVKKEDIIFMP